MTFQKKSLAVALIKNIRSNKINRNFLGHTITQTIGPITLEDMSVYVDATLDNPDRYGKKRCYVPPFYLSRLLYPMFRYFLTLKDLHLNLLRLVHGYQSVQWLGEFREGDVIDIKMIVADISDSSAGEMITLRTIGSVDNNEVVRADTTFIVRSKKNKDNKLVKTNIKEDNNKKEAFRAVFKTEKNQQLKYAKVSGDKNFIHTSKILAKFAGLPGMIMHGICIAAMTANTLLDEVLKGDMSRMKGISMRFANPVLPGDEITIIGYETEDENFIRFSAFNNNGRVILKNGEYNFK